MSIQLPCGVYVSGQGPAVVLLHSSLSSAKQWRVLINDLQKSYTCISIDLLGYGLAPQVKSSVTHNFRHELDRIKMAIEFVIGQQAFHLVGHSCGGAIALKYAVENQSNNKLLSLSLFEPVAFHLLNEGMTGNTEMDGFADKLGATNLEEATRYFIDFCNGHGAYNSLSLSTKNKMQQGMFKVKLDHQALMAEHYLLGELKNIDCSTLMMMGNDSPKLIHKLAQLISSNLPNVISKTFSAGHMAPITHAKLVNAEVIKHISQQDGL